MGQLKADTLFIKPSFLEKQLYQRNRRVGEVWHFATSENHVHRLCPSHSRRPRATSLLRFARDACCPRAVIKALPNDDAPGPDGFNGLFIKNFWRVIEVDQGNLCQSVAVAELNI